MEIGYTFLSAVVQIVKMQADLLVSPPPLRLNLSYVHPIWVQSLASEQTRQSQIKSTLHLGPVLGNQ
jgi:hypothetical protein